MVVQHNLTAMNSNRMLGITTNAQAKATEKLSSGYKINRAADDAAGLAISEKMRKQVRGLTQASSNAQDGISAVQTAEGALTEVHDMLQRMNELAIKAANGTMSESDRTAIQSEIDQLVTEIDRVSTTTKFNETYLLKGANGGTAGKLSYNTALQNGALAGKINAETGTGSIQMKSTSNGTATYRMAGDTVIKTKEFNIGSITYVLVESTMGVNSSNNQISTASSITKMSVTAAAAAISAAGANGVGTVTTLANGMKAGETATAAAEVLASTITTIKAFTSMDALTAAVRHDNADDLKSVSSFYDKNAGTIVLKLEAFADLNDAIDFSLHVGADSSSDNKINVNIAQMSARGLGINGLQIDGSDDVQATAAVDVIADALQKVSAQRASLGAVQNRLEHTISNLDNIVENTTAAESAVRDTDMATQMVTYSNNQILAQAGQAMLAQSNQTNQGVLSLLG